MSSTEQVNVDRYIQTHDTQDDTTVCQVCGQQNDAKRHECHNCKRPLSLEQAEHHDQLKEAVELYQRLEDGGLLKSDSSPTSGTRASGSRNGPVHH
jgi:hypothetical protein